MSDLLSSTTLADAARSAFEFRPPSLLRNGHVQTVLGHLLPGPPFTHPTRRHVVRLPDGDGLVLVGLSLGGNLALKMAGEAADRPVPGLDRVAAVNPPIDLKRCNALMERRHNRLYESYFVRAAWPKSAMLLRSH